MGFTHSSLTKTDSFACQSALKAVRMVRLLYIMTVFRVFHSVVRSYCVSYCDFILRLQLQQRYTSRRGNHRHTIDLLISLIYDLWQYSLCVRNNRIDVNAKTEELLFQTLDVKHFSVAVVVISVSTANHSVIIRVKPMDTRIVFVG